MAEVELEGVPVEAMLDTGSPVTIVSLNCLLVALAKSQPPGQTPEEWKAKVKERLQPASMLLKSYSGNELPIVKRIQVEITRGGYATKAWVHVQKDAPVDFLLGTDIQPHLGFHLVQVGQDGTTTNLLNVATPATGGVQHETSLEDPTHGQHENDGRTKDSGSAKSV